MGEGCSKTADRGWWFCTAGVARVGAEVAASYSPLLGTHDGAVLGLSDGSQGARNDCAQPFHYVAWHSSALAFLWGACLRRDWLPFITSISQLFHCSQRRKTNMLYTPPENNDAMGRMVFCRGRKIRVAFIFTNVIKRALSHPYVNVFWAPPLIYSSQCDFFNLSSIFSINVSAPCLSVGTEWERTPVLWSFLFRLRSHTGHWNVAVVLWARGCSAGLRRVV